jgi:cation diffusion facilitator family transporter
MPHGFLLGKAVTKLTTETGQVKKPAKKTSAAILSVISNTLLILLKVGAGFITGSVSILAEAIHSLLDLAAAIIAFFSVRMSDKPADAGHPFGHGKIEGISGSVEALLILVASGVIFYEAGMRIKTGTEIEFAEVGIGIMLVSILVNILVSRRLYKVSRITDSLALEADAGHLAADVYSSLAVIVSLLIVRLTGLNILDPLVAIGVGIYIMNIAYVLLRKSSGMLIDESLPSSEETEIKACIMEHSRQLVGFHELRTRRVGSERHIDLHLVMARDASLAVTHEICDHIEGDLKARFGHATITIHVEPCQGECGECSVSCPAKDKKC